MDYGSDGFSHMTMSVYSGMGGSNKAGFMGTTDGDKTTLYEALGVAENATSDEIKQAYYRLVRTFRPTEYPDDFARFSEANRILTDVRKRNEYDQDRRSGRRVQVLVDQAAAALDKDSQKAVSLLKNAIAFAPDMARPRHLLAHILMRVEDYAGAERQYRWLIKESPRDETLRYRFARCLHQQNRLADSEKELLNALRLNPAYFDALMMLSRVYESANKQGPAAEMLERAIVNDAKETYADFDPFQRLLVLYLLAGDAEGAERTAERLLAIIPADSTEKADRALRRLIQRATEFFDKENYRVATAILAVAERIVSGSEEMRQEALALAERISLTREARNACDDPLFIGALRDCIYLKYLDRSADAIRKQKMETALLALQTEIGEDPRTISGAVAYLRREYTGIAQDQNALLQELAHRAAKRLEILGPVSSTRGMPAVMPGNPAQNESEIERENGRKGIIGWLRGGRKD